MKAKVPVSRGQPCESIETRKAVKVQQRLSSLWLESNNRLLSTSSPPDPRLHTQRVANTQPLYHTVDIAREPLHLTSG